jgi:hypothetical protein
MKMMSSRHWRCRCGSRTLPQQIFGYLERVMKRLLWRLSRWFHSFDETDDDLARLIKSAEDGARMGMVGWY